MESSGAAALWASDGRTWRTPTCASTSKSVTVMHLTHQMHTVLAISCHTYIVIPYSMQQLHDSC